MIKSDPDYIFLLICAAEAAANAVSDTTGREEWMEQRFAIPPNVTAFAEKHSSEDFTALLKLFLENGVAHLEGLHKEYQRYKDKSPNTALLAMQSWIAGTRVLKSDEGGRSIHVAKIDKGEEEEE